MRPTFTGLEMHLATMLKIIKDFKPAAVILDPLNSFLTTDNALEAKAMDMRLIDNLKLNNITGFFTTLIAGDPGMGRADVFISSLIDTWLLLKDIELGGERNRVLYVLKSRGMAHSNQVREFLLTENGIVLRDVYIGLGGVLTGSSRIAQESKDFAEQLIHKQAIEQRKLAIKRKSKNLDLQIASLKAEFDAEQAELLKLIAIEEANIANTTKSQREIAVSRKQSGGKK